MKKMITVVALLLAANVWASEPAATTSETLIQCIKELASIKKEAQQIQTKYQESEKRFRDKLTKYRSTEQDGALLIAAMHEELPLVVETLLKKEVDPNKSKDQNALNYLYHTYKQTQKQKIDGSGVLAYVRLLKKYKIDLFQKESHDRLNFMEQVKKDAYEGEETSSARAAQTFFAELIKSPQE